MNIKKEVTEEYILTLSKDEAIQLYNLANQYLWSDNFSMSAQYPSDYTRCLEFKNRLFDVLCAKLNEGR